MSSMLFCIVTGERRGEEAEQGSGGGLCHDIASTSFGVLGAKRAARQQGTAVMGGKQILLDNNMDITTTDIYKNITF